jgi:hypothetical protein
MKKGQAQVMGPAGQEALMARASELGVFSAVPRRLFYLTQICHLV